MDTYDIVFLADGQDDQIRLASIRDGKVSGKMRRSVEQQIDLGSINIGITGKVITYGVGDPDVVAYALARSNGDLVEAGITEPGRVFAVDADGDEINFRYARSIGPDLLLAEEDVAPPVD